MSDEPDRDPTDVLDPGVLSSADTYQIAEFLLEGHDPDGFEVVTTPYWDEDLDDLHIHFDIYEEEPEPGRVRRVARRLNPWYREEVRQPAYTFQVPIPEESRLHPDHEEHSLEPTLPDNARRRFLKGMGLGTAVSIMGIGGATWYQHENRPPYEKAVSQARELVQDVRHAREYNTDRSKLYLGDVNTYGFGMERREDGRLGPAHRDAVSGVLEEGAVTVELVYLDEPLDSDIFLKRIAQEQIDLLSGGIDWLDTHHDLPDTVDDVQGHGTHAGPSILHEYYSELWEELSRAARKGDAYLDHQVDTLDQSLLDEAGERMAAEMSRVGGGAVDIDYSVRRERLGRQASLDRRRNELFQDYADDPKRFPVFVTTRQLEDLNGWGVPRQAVAQLPLGLLLEEDDLTGTAYGRSFVDLLLMEAGHGVYRLPHTADRADAMTYNDEYAIRNWVGGAVMGYGPITEALVERYVDGTVTSEEDGIVLDPATVGEGHADALFAHNNATYLTDMMGFPLAAWDTTYDRTGERLTMERDEERGTVTVTAEMDTYIARIGMETEER